MSLLFQFSRKDKMLLHPDAVKLCKHLKKLPLDELRYIALAYDYKSPYRRMPAVDRKRSAAREVWGLEADFVVKESTIEAAIKEYSMLQFDIRRDTCDKYITKIQTLNETLLTENDPRKIKILDEAVSGLEKRVIELQVEIDKDEAMEEMKAGGELSYLERWQNNARNERKNKPVGFADQRSGVIEFEDDKYED